MWLLLEYSTQLRLTPCPQAYFCAGNSGCRHSKPNISKKMFSFQQTELIFSLSEFWSVGLDCFGFRQAFFGGSLSKGKNFLKFIQDWKQLRWIQSFINFRKFLPLLREPPKKACLQPKQSSNFPILASGKYTLSLLEERNMSVLSYVRQEGKKGAA